MNIALIGATGFVGSSLLSEVLNRGHRVTAVVRHPDKVKTKHDNLKIVKGDALNENELAKLLAGHDAVISAYNPGWQNQDIYNEYLKGCKSILNAVKKSGIKRFLTVGGAGSLEIKPEVQLVDAPDFPGEWKQGALAARDFLNIIKKENSLDWTFLSPAIMLQPGTKTGKFRIGTDQPVFDANNKCEISVDDLAVALINELEKPKFIKKRFTVGY